jgi:large subunit ribosomal protein L32
MGGVPARHFSKNRRNSRRAQLKLTAAKLVNCPHCHKPSLSHKVCPNCGYYNGKMVVDVMAKLDKKEKKAKAKELKESSKESK